MTNITTNIEAKMILHLEASRVQAIKQALIDEETKPERRKKLLDMFSGGKQEIKFNWLSCVPNIKVPTNEQIMMLRFGSSFDKIKQEAKEHFKKEKL